MTTPDQTLRTNRALLSILAEELGDAMRLYDFIPTPQTQAKVALLQQQYDELSEKVASADNK